MKEKATPEPGIKPCTFCGSVGKLEEVESEDGYRFDVYCTNTRYCALRFSMCSTGFKGRCLASLRRACLLLPSRIDRGCPQHDHPPEAIPQIERKVSTSS